MVASENVSGALLIYLALDVKKYGIFFGFLKKEIARNKGSK